MTAPKLHHYVPQFYLRRFVDESNHLWVWDKATDRVFPTNPSGIAGSTQFYRLTQYEAEGHDPLTMEKQFADLEGEVSKITTQWLDWLPRMNPSDRVPLPRPNRRIVALYLALQVLRTFDTRELLSALVEMDSGVRPTPEQDRVNHTELIWDDAVVEKLTKRFASSVWVFAQNRTGTPFITSDNPISFRSSDNRRWLRSLALEEDSYLSFPLSPEAILYCYPKKGRFQKLTKFANRLSPVTMDDKMVQDENTGQVFMASRFVISCRSVFEQERAFARTIGTDTFAPSTASIQSA